MHLLVFARRGFFPQSSPSVVVVPILRFQRAPIASVSSSVVVDAFRGTRFTSGSPLPVLWSPSHLPFLRFLALPRRGPPFPFSLLVICIFPFFDFVHLCRKKKKNVLYRFDPKSHFLSFGFRDNFMQTF